MDKYMIHSIKLTGENSLNVDIKGFFISFSFKETFTRPYIDFSYGYGFRYITFTTSMHNWFKEMNIEYSLRFDKGIFIDFNEKQSIMIFKLTWV